MIFEHTMNLEHTLLSMLLTIFLPLVCFVVVLLLLKFAAKLNWLTAICLSVFAVTIISIPGIRILSGMKMKIGSVFLLPAVVCGVIMIIQLFRWVISSDNASVNTAERNRILQMVEDSKISTEEGTELLDAMGRSTALQGQDKFSRLDIVILVGVALVILGFFLPWAYLGRGMYQAGHHRGPIGWAVLIVAVLSAVPIFVTPKDLLYKISMLQIFLILVGLALVIKELAVGADQAGSIFCAGGFVVAFFGSVIKLKSLAA